MSDEYNYSLRVDAPAEYQLQVGGDDSLTLTPSESVEVNINVIYDLNTGRPVRFWFGTIDEYNALEHIYGDVCYNIVEG